MSGETKDNSPTPRALSPGYSEAGRRFSPGKSPAALLEQNFFGRISDYDAARREWEAPIGIFGLPDICGNLKEMRKALDKRYIFDAPYISPQAKFTLREPTFTQIANKGILSTLPACSSSNEGTIRGVTDSNTNTWGANIAGGSINHILAYCDGSAWTVAAK